MAQGQSSEFRSYLSLSWLPLPSSFRPSSSLCLPSQLVSQPRAPSPCNSLSTSPLGLFSKMQVCHFSAQRIPVVRHRFRIIPSPWNGLQSLPASLALHPLIPPCTLLYTSNYNDAVLLHAFRPLHMLFSLPEKPYCILSSRQTRIHPLNMNSNTISLNLPH